MKLKLPKFDAAYEYEKEKPEPPFYLDVDEHICFLSKSMDYTGFLVSYAGRTYGRGLYRTHNYSSGFKWSNLLEGYYPEFKDRLLCFGYDWEGNMIALRVEEDHNVVMIFEIATGDYYELEQSIAGFHEEDLIAYVDDTLHKEKFLKASSVLGIDRLPWTACIGHKISLLLGGDDVIANREVNDIDVLWSIQQQIIDDINKLP